MSILASNVDPDVATLRATLARATQTGDMEKVIESRVRLEIAKATADATRLAERHADALALQQRVQADQYERLAEERARAAAAAAFLADPHTGAFPGGRTRENHNALDMAQIVRTAAFIKEHGRPSADRPWSPAQQAEYQALIGGAVEAHKIFGCSKTDPCRQG